MRLSKIQKFLKENNINYKYSVDKYSNNEFGTITIQDSKTKFTSFSEVTGTRGTKVNGIFVSYRENNRSISYTSSSQINIINRLKEDIESRK